MSVTVLSCDSESLTETCEDVTKIHAKGWLAFFRQAIPCRVSCTEHKYTLCVKNCLL